MQKTQHRRYQNFFWLLYIIISSALPSAAGARSLAKASRVFAINESKLFLFNNYLSVGFSEAEHSVLEHHLPLFKVFNQRKLSSIVFLVY